MPSATRREIIRNGVVAGGVLFGAAAVYRSDSPDSGNQPASTMIQARGLRLSSPDFRKGRQPSAGERILVTAELFDVTGETAVGHLYGEYVALGNSRGGAGSPASLETHTFAFADGTLIGRGAATRDLTTLDSFAIVGGTGRYAGATGTYTARQGPLELGGDGTAEYQINLA
ncbi:MAG: dirigent protein [Acidimicrobiia bacterium]|nr:dirigent protein [Acidimicrobiia bacterium]